MQQSRKSQSSRQQKQQGLGNQKQIILGQDELDTLYVGNLSEDINESDLFELFGLCTTNHLRGNSDVQIPLSENTGKKRGFAYVKEPRHVSDELLRLHGIGFKGKMLVIEKAKTPPKVKNINGMNQNHCAKSVRILSYSGPHFPAFYSNRIRENADQNNSEYGHFLRSEYISTDATFTNRL